MSWFGFRKNQQSPDLENVGNFGGFGDIEQLDGGPSDPRMAVVDRSSADVLPFDDNSGSSDDDESESSIGDFSMGDESTVDGGIPLFNEDAYSLTSDDEMSTQDSTCDVDDKEWKRKQASSFLSDFYNNLGTESEASTQMSDESSNHSDSQSSNSPSSLHNDEHDSESENDSVDDSASHRSLDDQLKEKGPERDEAYIDSAENGSTHLHQNLSTSNQPDNRDEALRNSACQQQLEIPSPSVTEISPNSSAEFASLNDDVDTQVRESEPKALGEISHLHDDTQHAESMSDREDSGSWRSETNKSSRSIDASSERTGESWQQNDLAHADPGVSSSSGSQNSEVCEDASKDEDENAFRGNSGNQRLGDDIHQEGLKAWGRKADEGSGESLDERSSNESNGSLCFQRSHSDRDSGEDYGSSDSLSSTSTKHDERDGEIEDRLSSKEHEGEEGFESNSCIESRGENCDVLLAGQQKRMSLADQLGLDLDFGFDEHSLEDDVRNEVFSGEGSGCGSPELDSARVQNERDSMNEMKTTNENEEEHSSSEESDSEREIANAESPQSKFGMFGGRSHHEAQDMRITADASEDSDTDESEASELPRFGDKVGTTNVPDRAFSAENDDASSYSRQSTSSANDDEDWRQESFDNGYNRREEEDRSAGIALHSQHRFNQPTDENTVGKSVQQKQRPSLADELDVDLGFAYDEQSSTSASVQDIESEADETYDSTKPFSRKLLLGNAVPSEAAERGEDRFFEDQHDLVAPTKSLAPMSQQIRGCTEDNLIISVSSQKKRLPLADELEVDFDFEADDYCPSSDEDDASITEKAKELLTTGLASSAGDKTLRDENVGEEIHNQSFEARSRPVYTLDNSVVDIPRSQTPEPDRGRPTLADELDEDFFVDGSFTKDVRSEDSDGSSVSDSARLDLAREMLECGFDHDLEPPAQPTPKKKPTLADELEEDLFASVPVRDAVLEDKKPSIARRRPTLADELDEGCFDATIELPASHNATKQEPATSNQVLEDSDSDSESSSGDDSSDSESDSDGDGGYSSKVVIREAPLLRLENCTSMTRTAIAETKNKKKQNAKSWGWFGFGGKKPNGMVQPPSGVLSVQDDAQSESEEGEHDEGEKKGSSNSEIPPKTSTSEIPRNRTGRHSRSQLSVTSETTRSSHEHETADGDEADDPTTQFFKSQKDAGDAAIHVDKAPWKDEESVASSRFSASKSLSNGTATGSVSNKSHGTAAASVSNGTVGSGSKSASSGKLSISSPQPAVKQPNDIKAPDKTSSAEDLLTVVADAANSKAERKKKKKEKKKAKKAQEGSLKAHFGQARRVGRHGDEVSVGTMNVKKSTNQHIVLSKASFEVDDESLSQRPWRKEGKPGRSSKRSSAPKLGATETIQECEEDTDFSETGSLILILENEAPLLGNEPNQDDESEESQTSLAVNEQTQPVEEDEEIDALMLSLSALENTMLGEDDTKKVDFDDMWDEVSVDMSTALEFDRKKQEKERRDFKRAVRRQKREEAKTTTVEKRIPLFSKAEKTCAGKKNKSKLSDEFMDAIHKVFEDDESSNGTLASNAESVFDLNSGDIDLSLRESSHGDDFTTKSAAASSHVLDEESSFDGDLSKSKSGSSVSNSRGSQSQRRSGDSIARMSSFKTRGSKRSSKSRSSRKLKGVNPSDIFEEELRRQKSSKSLSISNLKQEMVDRRGSSQEYLHREYEQHRDQQDALRNRLGDTEESDSEDEEPKPQATFVVDTCSGTKTNRGRRGSLGMQLNSRWDSSESVSDLDDLRTVVETDSPPRPAKLFATMTDVTQTVAIGAIDLAAERLKQADKAAHDAANLARLAGSEARGLASGAVQATRTASANVVGNLPIINKPDPQLTMQDVGNLSFRASFDDMPLTTIGEVEDYEDENEQGLLGGSSDGKWDEASVGNRSLGSRSSRFSLKGKLPKVGMAGGLKKMKNMLPKKTREKSGSNGIALGDDEHGLLGYS